MKVLVTGGTGFIGKHLLPLLRDRGHEIVVLTRNPNLAGVRLPVVCRVAPWDPLKGPLDPKNFDGIDAVVHLAGENVGEGRWTRDRKHRISQSRILSTRLLADSLGQLNRKPGVFISASAAGFYGDRAEGTMDESAPSGEGFLAEVCRQWEAEIFRMESMGIRSVAMRFGVVLGQDGGAMEKMLPLFRMGLGGPLGTGRQWMSWIHVRDAAGLILHALEHSTLNGPVNTVAPHPVTNREFARTLGQVLCRPVVLPAPAIVLKLLLGEMSGLLLAGQKVSAEKARASGYKFVYPKLETALRVICDHIGHELILEQWIPRPIDEAFAFFSDPRNLEDLTPPRLNFKVIRLSPKTMGEGTQLDYRLKLHGIPFYWQSTITGWHPEQRFSDLQTRGPYNFWHHIHEFVEKDGGTILRDKAVYKIPLGIPGDVLLHDFIRRDLESIFYFRRRKIEEMFGQKGG